jgi:hypothetical protein
MEAVAIVKSDLRQALEADLVSSMNRLLEETLIIGYWFQSLFADAISKAFALQIATDNAGLPDFKMVVGDAKRYAANAANFVRPEGRFKSPTESGLRSAHQLVNDFLASLSSLKKSDIPTFPTVSGAEAEFARASEALEMIRAAVDEDKKCNPAFPMFYARIKSLESEIEYSTALIAWAKTPEVSQNPPLFGPIYWRVAASRQRIDLAKKELEILLDKQSISAGKAALEAQRAKRGMRPPSIDKAARIDAEHERKLRERMKLMDASRLKEV